MTIYGVVSQGTPFLEWKVFNILPRFHCCSIFVNHVVLLARDAPQQRKATIVELVYRPTILPNDGYYYVMGQSGL